MHLEFFLIRNYIDRKYYGKKQKQKIEIMTRSNST